MKTKDTAAPPTVPGHTLSGSGARASASEPLRVGYPGQALHYALPGQRFPATPLTVFKTVTFEVVSGDESGLRMRVSGPLTRGDWAANMRGMARLPKIAELVKLMKDANDAGSLPGVDATMAMSLQSWVADELKGMATEAAADAVTDKERAVADALDREARKARKQAEAGQAKANEAVRALQQKFNAPRKRK